MNHKNTKNKFTPPTESPAANIWTPISEAIKENKKHIINSLSEGAVYADTEDINGRLFYEMAGYFFRYESVNGTFMVYDGKRWMPDRYHLAETAAAEVGLLRQELLIYAQPHELKSKSIFAAKSRSAQGIRSTLFFAKSQPELSTVITDYDSQPDLLNTPDGIVNLKNNTVQKHNPNLLLSKITNYGFLENPTGKQFFEKFLNDITQGRDELKQAHQRFLGSGLSGRPHKQKLAIWHGGGANGKGVLLETVLDIIGDYSSTTPVSTFQKKQNISSSHDETTAALRGSRMVGTSEPNASIQLDEGKIKLLTGGDTVSCSHKHGRQFNFRPCFSIIISTNHRPRVSGRDNGIWRRLLLFPFDLKIEPKKQISDLKEQLLNNSGTEILRWLIRGAIDWTNESWGEFPTIEAATALYREDEDVLKDFIEDHLIFDNNRSISKTDLRDAYTLWCERTAERPMSVRAFREAMIERGLTEGRNYNEGRIWIGAKLK